ncbi:MAG: hypothetical protein QOI46_2123 [Alphaproteobacteria bacterium]|nr:hypothetical protein [Alphaproteobacteria bacterium]
MTNTVEKIALFIDGANLHFTAKNLGFDIDFKRLLVEFQRRGSLVRAYYYTTIIEDAEFISIRPLIDWLDYNGFPVTAKPAKEFDDGDGRRKVKRNIGVELVVDALEIARRVDHIVLFSGNGDLRALVEAVRRKGIHVMVVSSLRTKPAMVADELRREADTFLELDDLKTSIGRTLKPVQTGDDEGARAENNNRQGNLIV